MLKGLLVLHFYNMLTSFIHLSASLIISSMSCSSPRMIDSTCSLSLRCLIMIILRSSGSLQWVSGPIFNSSFSCMALSYNPISDLSLSRWSSRMSFKALTLSSLAVSSYEMTLWALIICGSDYIYTALCIMNANPEDLSYYSI